MSPQQKVTVVTGASGALGSEVVRFLGEIGHHAAAVDRKTSTPEAWSAALGEIEATAGPPSGAVLVAGAWKGGARFFEPAADEHWPAMLSANLESARTALRALLPGMVARRSGSIVLIGSRDALRPWESSGAAAYAASKAALMALAQSVAAEVLRDGVRVNVVAPSTIDTAANRAAMPDADSSRWVKPRSLAAVIGFLLSDEAADISGANVPVYGRVGV